MPPQHFSGAFVGFRSNQGVAGKPHAAAVRLKALFGAKCIEPMPVVRTKTSTFTEQGVAKGGDFAIHSIIAVTKILGREFFN